MPFTLSHAAVALPFRKLKPIWPALVIGTFAPDIQYFLFISDENRSWHQWPGVIVFALPVALLLLWVFESFVKSPVIELLPSCVQLRLQGKLAPLSFIGANQFLAIVLWIGIGILTHIVWDQFTHSYSWLGEGLMLLRLMVQLPFGHRLAVAHLLQHFSTIGGFLILCWWVAAWYQRTSPEEHFRAAEFSPAFKIATALTMAGIALMLGYPLAVIQLARHVEPVRRLAFIVTVFEAVTLVFCAQLILYGLALTVSTRWRRLPAGQLQEPGD